MVETPTNPSEVQSPVGRTELAQGEHIATTPEGRAILRKDADGGLLICSTSPIRAELSGGKAAKVRDPDGNETPVLQVGIGGLSEGGHDGVMVTKMQFDAKTILGIIQKAVEVGIIDQGQTEQSKWAPGGKMEQMANLAKRLEKDFT